MKKQFDFLKQLNKIARHKKPRFLVIDKKTWKILRKKFIKTSDGFNKHETI